jgi:cell division protein ZapA (FtsZ GTPase activity inhibitor)
VATKRSISVSIAGQRFVLRSDADDRTVQHLAAQLDRRIRDIHKASRGTADSQQVATLAALQLAEELHSIEQKSERLAESLRTERAETETLKKKVRERSRNLLKLLNRAGV